MPHKTHTSSNEIGETKLWHLLVYYIIKHTLRYLLHSAGMTVYIARTNKYVVQKAHKMFSVLQMEWEMWKDVSQTTYFSATCITPSDTIWTNRIPLTKNSCTVYIGSCLNHTLREVLVFTDQVPEAFNFSGKAIARSVQLTTVLKFKAIGIYRERIWYLPTLPMSIKLVYIFLKISCV